MHTNQPVSQPCGVRCSCFCLPSVNSSTTLKKRRERRGISALARTKKRDKKQLSTMTWIKLFIKKKKAQGHALSWRTPSGNDEIGLAMCQHHPYSWFMHACDSRYLLGEAMKKEITGHAKIQRIGKILTSSRSSSCCWLRLMDLKWRLNSLLVWVTASAISNQQNIMDHKGYIRSTGVWGV